MKISENILVVFLFLLVSLVEMPDAMSATITSTLQGGKWLEPSTWVGNVVPTQNDDVVITSTVTANGQSYTSTNYQMRNLTVNAGGKIIREKNSGGLSYLTISGNLVNNGEIVDYNDYFDVDLLGNLVNNGVLKPRNLTFSGQSQQISGFGVIEAKKVNLSMSDEFLTAASALYFKNAYIYPSTTKKIKMNNFSLNLMADSIRYDSYYGSVSSSSGIYVPVVFDGTGVLNLENSIVGGIIYGNVTVKSPSYAFIKDLTVEGNLTLEKGKISSYANRQTLRVKGNFTNYTNLNKDTVTVRNVEFAPRSMYLYVYGNSDNLGSTGITTVYPVTNGKTISVKGDYYDVYCMQAENSDKPGGKVIVDSELNVSGDIDVYADFEIKKGGKLNLLSKTSTSPLYVRADAAKLTNNGTINRYHRVNNSWSYRSFTGAEGTFADLELRDWTDRIEGLNVSVFSNQAYPGLPGSMSRWWRIRPDGTATVKAYILKLYYDESMLNGKKEKNLKVYRSTDEGKNWEVVSAGEFSVLDTVQNTITIGRWDKPTSMMNEFGDFVISTGDGSVPVESGFIVDMVGRPNVRVGAPNPFTIHVYNVTDYRTAPIMLTMAVSEDIRFKEVKFPNKDGVEVLPVDSISGPDDLTQVFFIPYLEPNEHYTFEVTVYGLTESLKSTQENLVTLTLGGFFGHVAEDEATDYIVDKVGEAVDLDKAEKEEYARGLGLTVNQLKTEKQQYGKTVTTIRHVSKYTVKKIAETNPVTKVLYKIGEGAEAVYKIKDSLRQRLFHWFYKEVGLYGVEEKVASGKQVNGKLVKSWDPNEMVGPAGYGDRNFVASLPELNYTILFENKKEATAPAYQVQIIDTLSAVFDPETVQFLETSHSGPSYNWKMERNGNILKWDIEGIELVPNVTPPQGEGYVRFSVKPKAGLPSGTVIENRATIIFDMNAPITTNTWENILDMQAPVTAMANISYTPGDKQVTITGQASDNQNGSGIGRYELYASADAAPFLFAGESYDGSFSFPVSDSTKIQYRFYILATDNVDNAESQIPALSALNTLLVSVKQPNRNEPKIEVYPNPTSGWIKVEILSDRQTPVEIGIVSADGRLLKEERAKILTAGKQSVDINLSEFGPGLYFVHVKSINSIATFKVIRN